MKNTVTLNRTPPDPRHIISKHWHTIEKEPKLKQNFKNSLLVAFKRYKNLREFIGGNKLYNNKKLTHAKIFDKGNFCPCLTRTLNFCCKQIISKLCLQSSITRNTFDICKIQTSYMQKQLRNFFDEMLPLPFYNLPIYLQI